MNHTDQSSAIGKRVTATCFSSHGTGDARWITGGVVTPLHMVTCYSQEGYSRMDTVHGGKWITRSFQREMSQRSLAIQAGKWSRELEKQNGGKV